jgi:hypothetical protein
MISLNHLLIDEDVFTSSFACDLAACKGACCTLPGGGGAPVRNDEVEAMHGALDAALAHLPDDRAAAIREHGFLEGPPGHQATRCVDDRDCVFVVYDGDVATCSFERAWHQGTSTFRKPLSCHLFPIRVADFGGPYLHYQQFEECAPGRARGERESVPLLNTVREALERAFGHECVDDMLAVQREIRGGEQ